MTAAKLMASPYLQYGKIAICKAHSKAKIEISGSKFIALVYPYPSRRQFLRVSNILCVLHVNVSRLDPN